MATNTARRRLASMGQGPTKHDDSGAEDEEVDDDDEEDDAVEDDDDDPDVEVEEEFVGETADDMVTLL